MSKGPEQLKFEQAVGEKGASRSQSGDLLLAKQRWHSVAKVLRDSADQLELRAASAPSVSDQTGTAMQAAFLRTAASMRERAAKLDAGAEALGDAATTLHAAEQAKSQLRDLHDPGAWTGGTTVTEQEVKAKSDYDTARSTYIADRQHNEIIAAQHNRAMDSQNEKSTAVMKQVYGYQDPAPAPERYGSGHSQTPGTPGSASSSAPSGGSTTHGTTSPGSPVGGSQGTGQPGTSTQHGPGTTTGTTTGPTGSPTGTPQGTVAAPAANAGILGAGSFSPTAPASAPAGSVGTSFGGVGATLGAGIVGGAGGMIGGVRGGAALPTSGPAGTSAARALGTSSRSGSAGTLGRAATARGAALSAEEEAAAGRSGTAARGPGSVGTGANGSRGAAGRSGAASRNGRGVGAGGQSTRGRKKGRGAEVDHLIIEEDWLDDEGRAPAVLD